MADYDSQLSIAQDHSSPSDALAALANCEQVDVQRSLAANPNTPISLLVTLGSRYPSEVLENPVFPLLLLEQPDFISTLPIRSLQALLREPDAPLYLLEAAADRAEIEVQLAFISNVKTPKTVLERLLKSRSEEVRYAAGLHVAIAGEASTVDWIKINNLLVQLGLNSFNNRMDTAVIAWLSGLPESLVRVWLEENLNRELTHSLANCRTVSPGLLSALIEDASDFGTQRNALRNPNASIDSIRWQAENGRKDFESTRIANLILEERENASHAEETRPPRKDPRKSPYSRKPFTLRIPQSLFGQRTDASTEALAKAAGEESDPTKLAALSRHPSIKVRRAIATNPNTSLSTFLEHCIRQPRLYGEVMKLMVEEKPPYSHSQDPGERNKILDLLSDICLEPLETKLTRLIEEGTTGIHLFLASRWDMPSECLHQLARKDVAALQARVGDHPNTLPETLRFLSGSTHSQAREAAAYNERTPVDCLEALACDDEVWGRSNVAKNPSASAQCIAVLSADSDAQVMASLFENPNLPAEEVQAMLCDSRALKLLDRQPDIGIKYAAVIPAVMNHYFEKGDLIVRYFILCSSNVDESSLAQASQSLHWVERLAAAQNEKTPSEAVVRLKADAHQIVRAAANQYH